MKVEIDAKLAIIIASSLDTQAGIPTFEQAFHVHACMHAWQVYTCALITTTNNGEHGTLITVK